MIVRTIILGGWDVNTIKISETKLKVILSADDMANSHIAGDVDYTDPDVRDALKALLRQAGQKVGFDVDKGRSFIQLYPDKTGGCELFLTLLDGGSPKSPPTGVASETEGSMPTKGATAPTGVARYKFAVNIYEFSELTPLLRACKRLGERRGACSRSEARMTGERDAESAVYVDEDGGRYFFVVIESGRGNELESAELICAEYGGRRRKNSAYAYINEHCRIICDRGAIEKLGALA